jgi:hypothetical protein
MFFDMTRENTSRLKVLPNLYSFYQTFIQTYIFYFGRCSAVTMFLASVVRGAFTPLKIFKMVDIQGVNASHKFTG